MDKKNGASWNIGDECYIVRNKKVDYNHPFKIVDFDGKYYFITDGKYNHRCAPYRIHRKLEE